MPGGEWIMRVERLVGENFGVRVGVEELSSYHFRLFVLSEDDERNNFSFDIFRNAAGRLRLGDWRPSEESLDIKGAVERLIEEMQPRGRAFKANAIAEDQLIKLRNLLETRDVTMVPIQCEEYRFRLNVEHSNLGRGSGSVYFRKSGLNSDTWSNETCSSGLSDIVRWALLQVAPLQKLE